MTATGSPGARVHQFDLDGICLHCGLEFYFRNKPCQGDKESAGSASGADALTPQLEQKEHDECLLGTAVPGDSQRPPSTPNSDPIMGHKTFSDGHHEPLRQSEAAALIKASDEAKARRVQQMPDERAAIDAMFNAWLRLKELGWREAQYCPKDGSSFDVIEPGSAGIHRCRYNGEWPKGSWWIEGDGDLWPSRPVLFRSREAR